MGKLAQQMGGQSQVKVYAKGGAVHDDEVQDRKLIKKMMKSEEKAEGKKSGGKVMKKGGKCGR